MKFNFLKKVNHKNFILLVGNFHFMFKLFKFWKQLLKERGPSSWVFLIL